jgi:hypothetical protein
MSILDAFNRNYQSYTDQVYGPGGYYTTSPSRMDYNINANRAATELMSNTLQQGLGSFGKPAAAIAELAAPALALGSSPFHDIAQAAQRAKQNYDMPTGYGRIYDYMETPVGPTMSEFAKAVAAEQIPSTMIQRAMGAAVPLSNRIQTGLDLIGNFGFSPAKVNDFGVTSDFGYPSTPSVSKTTVAQPFNDYYGPTNIDTSFGVANEEDVEEDVEGARRTGGIADLFRAVLGFAVPGAGLLMGAGKGILGGIQNLNQRLRNTTFGRSETLADYFQAKRNQKAREAARQRGIDKEMARSGTGRDIKGSDFGGDFGQRAGGGGFSGTGPSSDITGTEGSF